MQGLDSQASLWQAYDVQRDAVPRYLRSGTDYKEWREWDAGPRFSGDSPNLSIDDFHPRGYPVATRCEVAVGISVLSP